MSQIEPGDREEMLLQGILNGDTTTNIEPGSRKEMLLKAILEEGGGGGSGEGIPRFELESYNGVAKAAITMGDVDYIGDDEKRSAFYVTDGKKIVIVVPVYSPYNRMPCLVIGEGKVAYGAVAKVDEKKYYFAGSETSLESPVSPLSFGELYIRGEIYSGQNNDVLIYDEGRQRGHWANPSVWAESVGLTGIRVIDLTSAQDSFNQIITPIKQLSSATPETTVTKYMALSGTMSEMAIGLIVQAETTIRHNKMPVCLMNNKYFIAENVFVPPNGSTTLSYQELDTSNDKIYDIKLIFTATKFYIQCTCHEATSLM